MHYRRSEHFFHYRQLCPPPDQVSCKKSLLTYSGCTVHGVLWPPLENTSRKFLYLQLFVSVQPLRFLADHLLNLNSSISFGLPCFLFPANTSLIILFSHQVSRLSKCPTQLLLFDLMKLHLHYLSRRPMSWLYLILQVRSCLSKYTSHYSPLEEEAPEKEKI